MGSERANAKSPQHKGRSCTPRPRRFPARSLASRPEESARERDSDPEIRAGHVRRSQISCRYFFLHLGSSQTLLDAEGCSATGGPKCCRGGETTSPGAEAPGPWRSSTTSAQLYSRWSQRATSRYGAAARCVCCWPRELMCANPPPGRTFARQSSCIEGKNDTTDGERRTKRRTRRPWAGGSVGSSALDPTR